MKKDTDVFKNSLKLLHFIALNYFPIRTTENILGYKLMVGGGKALLLEQKSSQAPTSVDIVRWRG